MLRIKRPATIYVSFLSNPNTFFVYDQNGKEYYRRYLTGREKGIKINIPDNGFYTFSEDCVFKEKPLEINGNINKISLPTKERNRYKSYKIIHDDKEIRSPALIYTKQGIIITGKRFKDFSIPTKIFLLLHEIGHFYYETEKYCDLFSLVHFVKAGYNVSSAMYCLTDILRRRPENDERINYIFDKISKAELIK